MDIDQVLARIRAATAELQRQHAETQDFAKRALRVKAEDTDDPALKQLMTDAADGKISLAEFASSADLRKVASEQLDENAELIAEYRGLSRDELETRLAEQTAQINERYEQVITEERQAAEQAAAEQEAREARRVPPRRFPPRI